MRVLCLHAAASSALQLSRDMRRLEERLWEKHRIELVFVDAPLRDARLGASVGEVGGGIHAVEPLVGDDEEELPSRRWYVEERDRRAEISHGAPAGDADSQHPPPPSSLSPSIKYSGLDASLLHLSQIWTRGGASNGVGNNGESTCEYLPFHGIMGMGQGADVAGMLPLLNRHYNEDDDDEKENAGEGLGTSQAMFGGLQFVILIDGRDIVGWGQDDQGSERNGGLDEDHYVGPDGVRSLHIIAADDAAGSNGDGANDAHSLESERLARKYGPNAEIKRCKRSSVNAISNVVGKFLVEQKNILHSNPLSRELMLLQNRLVNVEQLAALAISQEIQRNPPKALMAAIGPAAVMPNSAEGDAPEENEDDARSTREQGAGLRVDDRAVAAWSGARRREFGEEGGGAPCPKEFLLRGDDR